MTVDVVHRPEQSRFEAAGDGTGGEVGFLAYERSGDTVVLTHTVVPPEHAGHGVGAALAAAAVGWAREEGLAVDPQCSYVRAWLGKQA